MNTANAGFIQGMYTTCNFLNAKDKSLNTNILKSEEFAAKLEEENNFWAYMNTMAVQNISLCLR